MVLYFPAHSSRSPAHDQHFFLGWGANGPSPNDYLVARRSELIISEVDEIEYLTNMVNAAKLSELEEVELELSEIEGELLLNRFDAQVVIQRLREWLTTQKSLFTE